MNDVPAPRTVLRLVNLVAAAALVAGCATRQPPPASSPTSPPGGAAGRPAAAASGAPTSAAAPAASGRSVPAPLTGHVSRGALEDYETWKTLRGQDYVPDAEAVKTIADRARDVDVLLILATWCPDSKREVPRFFRIYDQSGLDLARVTMIAVDRTKKDAEGLTQKHGVERVPTFIFFRAGRELGRVVERATTTLEADMAAIVAER